MDHQKKKKILVLSLILVLLLAAVGCGEKETEAETGSSAEPPSVSDTRVALDTAITITLYDWTERETLDKAFAEIDRLEHLLSVDMAGSDMERLWNSAGKEFVQVSPETRHVLQSAVRFSELSGGLFDVTAGPLISLWNISGGTGYVPTEQEIEAAMSLIDYRQILFKDNKVMLGKEGMKGNLGAIAKGYIADRLKEVLKQEGVTSAMVNLGGNVVLLGSKPDGGDFHVGIQDPFADTGTPIGSITASDLSLVSSGIYERCFEQDGVWYHHILDPTTGRPADTGVAGVTVVCDSSEEADALSTSVFLMGAKKGMELIESIEGAEVLFILNDGSFVMSRGMEEVFTAF